MNNDIRNEFEVYVKKLTTSICKEIFLEKLSELYQKYENEYIRYSQTTSLAEQTSRILANEAKTINQSLDEKISHMESNTKQLFADMKVFNEQKQDDFIIALSNHVNGYKQEVSSIFEEGNKKLSDKLHGIITPEILQHFLDSLNENTEETKRLASFVGEEYKNEAVKSIKAIVQANADAMELTNKTVLSYAEKMTKELQDSQISVYKNIEEKTKNTEDYISRYVSSIEQYFTKLIESERNARKEVLQEQRNLIAQIEPSEEKIEQLILSVNRLESISNNIQKSNVEFLTKMKELSKEQKDAKQLQKENEEESKKEIFGVLNSIYLNTGIAWGFALFFLLLFVYNEYGFTGSIVTVIIMSIAIVAFFLIKQHITKAHDMEK